MASIALSVAGTAIAGPIGGAIGGMVGGLIDNVLFPGPKQQLPPITTSTYGNAIARAWGPQNRLGVNMIWTSGFHHHTSKDDAKFVFGALGALMAQQTTVVVDLALVAGRGPWEPSWLQKIWANGTVIFDASNSGSPPTPDADGVVVWDLSHGSHEAFFDVTVYPGNNLQPPNSTIETSMGMGNTPAYRGRAYIVINGLQTAPFGNGVPVFQVLARAQTEITLAEVCLEIAEDCGIDPNTVSTSALTFFVEGYNITGQSDGVSALQPLGLVYNFDMAEVGGSLRFSPRGVDPLCTVDIDQIGSFASGEQQPDAYAWPRDPQLVLPKLASLTFIDPARDWNQNTQSAQRDTGSATSNLSTSVNITMTSDQARSVCDRLLWEAHVAAQSFTTTTDDRMIFLEPARTYAVQGPFGYESVRLTRLSRGVNGVIEIEGKRDYSQLYESTAPGAAAGSLPNQLQIGGPVNPPLFVEPNSKFPFITEPTLMIALSGGDGTTFNPAWNGCDIYVSTDDSNFVQIGSVGVPSTMGVMTTAYGSYGGSNPETGADQFRASFLLSNGVPPSQSAADAKDAIIPYFIGVTGSGEFLSPQNATALGDEIFSFGGDVYRGYFETSANAHAIGDPIVRLDSNVFRFPLNSVYIGKELYFRFVGGGETLDSVTTYSHTPGGAGFGGGVGGVPTTMGAPTPTLAPNLTAVVVGFVPPSTSDNITGVVVSRALGLAQPFSAAVVIGTAGAGSDNYVDVGVVYGDDYTYFTQAQNAIGLGAASAGGDISV